MLAAMKNQTNVLKVLIQNGSDINAKADYISTTALHEAAYKAQWTPPGSRKITILGKIGLCESMHLMQKINVGKC